MVYSKATKHKYNRQSNILEWLSSLVKGFDASILFLRCIHRKKLSLLGEKTSANLLSLLHWDLSVVLQVNLVGDQSYLDERRAMLTDTVHPTEDIGERAPRCDVIHQHCTLVHKYCTRFSNKDTFHFLKNSFWSNFAQPENQSSSI